MTDQNNHDTAMTNQDLAARCLCLADTVQKVPFGLAELLRECARALTEAAQWQAAIAEQPVVARLRFERGTPGKENDMPTVVSCNWMPDGVYDVYAHPPKEAEPAPQGVQDSHDTYEGQNDCRCEPSDYVPDPDYDGDGSADAMARRASKPVQAETLTQAMIDAGAVAWMTSDNVDPARVWWAMKGAATEHAEDERDKARRDAEFFGTGFLVDGQCVAPQRVQTITTQSTASEAVEREKFESYIKKDCGDLSTFGRAPNRHYKNRAVNHEWLGWQARAARGHVSERAAQDSIRESCARIAEQFGPSRPLTARNPSERVRGRWEGEQAASENIAKLIRTRGDASI